MGGQAKTEVRPGLRAGDEGSDLRQPEGGQAIQRLPAEVNLGLRRIPDTIPGEGGLDSPPGVPGMSLETSISPGQEVTDSQAGAPCGTDKSRGRKETLTGQGQAIIIIIKSQSRNSTNHRHRHLPQPKPCPGQG
jgi:hypothetical protein